MRKYYYFYYQRIPAIQNEFFYISAHCFPHATQRCRGGSSPCYIFQHLHVLFLMNLHLQFVIIYRRGDGWILNSTAC